MVSRDDALCPADPLAVDSRITEVIRDIASRFEDEVIDRLFVLNAARADQEKRAGLAAGAKSAKPKGAGQGTAKKAPKKGATLGAQASLGLPPDPEE